MSFCLFCYDQSWHICCLNPQGGKISHYQWTQEDISLLFDQTRYDLSDENVVRYVGVKCLESTRASLL